MHDNAPEQRPITLSYAAAVEPAPARFLLLFVILAAPSLLAPFVLFADGGDYQTGLTPSHFRYWRWSHLLWYVGDCHLRAALLPWLAMCWRIGLMRRSQDTQATQATTPLAIAAIILAVVSLAHGLWMERWHMPAWIIPFTAVACCAVVSLVMVRERRGDPAIWMYCLFLAACAGLCFCVTVGFTSPASERRLGWYLLTAVWVLAPIETAVLLGFALRQRHSPC